MNYEQRVEAMEAKGMTRSDAQGVVDAEDVRLKREMIQVDVPLYESQVNWALSILAAPAYTMVNGQSSHEVALVVHDEALAVLASHHGSEK